MSTILGKRIEEVKEELMENPWKDDSYYLAVSKKIMPNVTEKRNRWILQQLKNGRGRKPDCSKSYVGFNQLANSEDCQVILNGYDVSHLIKEYDYIVVAAIKSILAED